MRRRRCVRPTRRRSRCRPTSTTRWRPDNSVGSNGPLWPHNAANPPSPLCRCWACLNVELDLIEIKFELINPFGFNGKWLTVRLGPNRKTPIQTEINVQNQLNDGWHRLQHLIGWSMSCTNIEFINLFHQISCNEILVVKFRNLDWIWSIEPQLDQ